MLKSYRCPVTARMAIELWRGPVPCIPVNVFLREGRADEHWEDSTVRSKASSLRHFFLWLEDSGFDFWDPEVRLGGDGIREFRQFVQDRTDPGMLFLEEGSESLLDRLSSRGAISRSTGKRIMGEVLTLCRFWARTAAEQKALMVQDTRNPQRRRIANPRPSAFRFKGDKTDPVRRRQVEIIQPEILEKLWTFLAVETRPLRSAPLIDQALWAQRLMTFAMFVCTGARRGETVGVHTDDVFRDQDGWWLKITSHEKDASAFRANAKHGRGARWKRGSRTIPIVFQPEFETAYFNWMKWRPWLVGNTGLPDHGAFLLNERPRGAPVTYWGYVETFFTRLAADFGSLPANVVHGPWMFKLSPHRVRHSVETVLEDREVPLAFRQALLGHANPRTTLAYGSSTARRNAKIAKGVGSIIDQGGGSHG